MNSGNVLLPEHFSDLGAEVSFTSVTDFDLQVQIQQLVSYQVDRYLDRNVDEMENLHNVIRRSYEKPLFEAILTHTNGRRSRAAQLLGINRNTLHTRIEELAIQRVDSQF